MKPGSEVDAALAYEELYVPAFFSRWAQLVADLEGWMPRAQIGLQQDQVEAILLESKTALAPFTTPSGTLEGNLSAHIVSVTQPHNSEPANTAK